MSGKLMKEYHFHTLQSFLADIPAYAAILWLKFSGVFIQVNLPSWEQWFFDHGWFLLLTLRFISVFYDLYIKIQYEDVIKKESEELPAKPNQNWLQKVIKLFIKIFIR